MTGYKRKVFMPLKRKRTGGHVMIINPDDTPEPEQNTQILNALVKAHLWQKLIEQKDHSAQEIADKFKVHKTYVNRLIRLNFLSPKIKEQIIDGTQPAHLKLNDLIKHPSWIWSEQNQLLVV